MADPQQPPTPARSDLVPQVLAAERRTVIDRERQIQQRQRGVEQIKTGRSQLAGRVAPMIRRLFRAGAELALRGR